MAAEPVANRIVRGEKLDAVFQAGAALAEVAPEPASLGDPDAIRQGARRLARACADAAPS